ncbi:MAG TPA: 50S ribosomal protein L25 [Acidimicrobiales bacterium]|nr:50S ribosomal protein L25 [Acidimicrobiales bacterium]
MPDEITLPVEVGRVTGSRSSGRLRAAGKIPAVIYGHGTDPVSVAVDGRALRSALTTDAGLNALLDLQVDGASHLTVARDIQRDPVRGTVIHVDFQIVRRDEVIAAEVPVNLVGEPVELHRSDGVVDHQLFTLTVHATPGRIPNDIEIDISALLVGDTVRVGDIHLPEGVTTDVDPEAPVVVGQPPQVSEEDLVTEAEAEAAATLEAEEADADAQAGAETVAEGGDADTEG